MINRRKPPSESGIWIEWLRILDAKQSGATNSEIESAIKPPGRSGKLNLKEKFERAKEIRDIDYRLLAEGISPRI